MKLKNKNPLDTQYTKLCEHHYPTAMATLISNEVLSSEYKNRDRDARYELAYSVACKFINYFEEKNEEFFLDYGCKSWADLVADFSITYVAFAEYFKHVLKDESPMITIVFNADRYGFLRFDNKDCHVPVNPNMQNESVKFFEAVLICVGFSTVQFAVNERL